MLIHYVAKNIQTTWSIKATFIAKIKHFRLAFYVDNCCSRGDRTEGLSDFQCSNNIQQDN